MMQNNRNKANLAKSYLEDIKFIDSKMPSILVNWENQNKREFRGNCDSVRTYFLDTAMPAGKSVIYDLCEHRGLYRRKYFDPLYKWMNDYIKVLEGTSAYTENFFRKGLRLIYNYVIISTYFADKSELYKPLPSNIQDVEGRIKAVKAQNDFKKLVYILNSNLIGCSDNGLPFLPKIDSMELVEELAKMRNYLHKKCGEYRVGLLRV